jgi:hypothetical protein
MTPDSSDNRTSKAADFVLSSIDSCLITFHANLVEVLAAAGHATTAKVIVPRIPSARGNKLGKASR